MLRTKPLTAYRVRKYACRFAPMNSGIKYSFNQWEVRRGAKLVKRFERRCDAYAFARAANAGASS